MRCPVCKSERKKSKVFPRGQSSTLMGGSFSHYDEDGQYHRHDINQTEQVYSCSNGHVWVVRYKGPCPNKKCSWPDEEPVIKIYRPEDYCGKEAQRKDASSSNT